MLVCLAGMAWGADIYVANTAAGDGLGTASDWSNAMSLAVACSTGFTAGNVYHLKPETYTHTSSNVFLINAKDGGPGKVIYVCDAGTAIITNNDTITAGYEGALYLLNSQNIVIDRIAFAPVSGTNFVSGIRVRASSANVSGNIIRNCTLTSSAVSLNAVAAIKLQGTSSYTVGCDILNNTITAVSAGTGITLDYAGNTLVSGNTITSSSSTYAVYCPRAALADFDNNTFTLTGTYGLYAAANDAKAVSIKVRNNTFISDDCPNYMCNITDYWDNALLDSNTFIIRNTTTQTADGFLVGADAASTANPMGHAVVRNNRVYYDGTTSMSGHGGCIGSGANGTEVYGNRIDLPKEASSSLNIGLVVKAEYCSIYENTIKSYRGIFLKGGGYNSIFRNTIITNGTNAIELVNDTDLPYGNRIHHNIIVATEGAYAINTNARGHDGNYFDYNCYHLGNAKLANIGNMDKTAVSDLIAYWTTQTDLIHSGNDSHSIAVNPALIPQIDNGYKANNPIVQHLGAGANLAVAITKVKTIISN